MDALDLELNFLTMPDVARRALVVTFRSLTIAAHIGMPMPSDEHVEVMFIHSMIILGADRSDMEWLVNAGLCSPDALDRFDQEISEVTS